MEQEQSDPDTDALVEFLRERDAWCPACRYNLRGLTSPRCPECGRELKLSVGMTEPFLRAWITLAVSVVASSGIGLLMAWVLCREGWPRGSDEAELRVSIIIYVAMIPAAPIVLATRRRFLRQASVVQWRFALFAAIVSTAAFILLLSSVH
jgi:hypothetical protein